MKDGKFDCEILVALFKRKGATSENTGVFCEIGCKQKDFITSKTYFTEGESPAIGGVIDSDSWFLITNIRIIIGVRNYIHEYTLDSIQNATVDLKMIRNSHSSLKEWEKIVLTLSSGEKVTVDVEAGMPMGGVWSALVYVARRNKRQ